MGKSYTGDNIIVNNGDPIARINLTLNEMVRQRF